MKKLLTAGVVSVLALSVYGCATIVRGTSQEIPVTVMPYGARIFVNDEARGSTPATLTLKRTGSYQIKIKKVEENLLEILFFDCNQYLDLE